MQKIKNIEQVENVLEENNSINDTNNEINESTVRLFNRDNDKNKYKMFKIPDLGEKPRWVIVGGDGFIINKNPTKEELKSVKKWTFQYNSTETCYRCGISFDEVIGCHYREKDKDGKWLGIWDCRNCWERYDSNSFVNKTKLETDCRNGNLDSNSKQGIGYITAVLVKKFLEIEDCFDITDNFNHPEYDMIEHEDWGLIDAKGSSLLTKDGYLCHSFHTRKNKKADFFFCIGYDKNRKHVIAVFIIPNEEDVNKLDAITVSYNGNSKYNKHKESEEEIKKWDDLFHTLKLDNCPVLKKFPDILHKGRV
jgi:hypothetical protein